ncbi:insulinase family protein [Colwellia sp. 1_MG-2023]|uniref:insulinase family protein n=1 Tax=unclassified Colwellia TaxID=196834 RepID=UPI001C082B33|nr:MULTISPECIES: insulinase family protein [unclassified Colwellia]MBU2926557.1 insulinase family protein [Colwellia sp. C2M11]MDO6487516.1 insulinase family protein [Colwellia sp. 6_MG-2023]MDO6652595.1 insulinase family protein [Colwellia sp. 3_MG-2023]MDO6665196.1 insulinase family protein [Colwellia sp. 2_MG-2023]MDO6689482.1 insulinase family protein [Colwellia sp. 1_MG-2023]
MKQSPNDLKKYQPLTLDNGLRVLLINNAESEKSAAALAVNAGHFNDPQTRQGLAHFLEHMLFLGTRKFPDGSEYQKFINQHGGSNNAWTATEHTCFYFDIQHQYFTEALERFSQFFISPLLSDDFVVTERKNIEAEFKLKLKDDVRRLYDVHKETINQHHPFSKFSVGNLDTLADRNNESISKEINAFFNQYYQASSMTLAIEGPQPLAELQHLAESMFSGIQNNSQPLNKITEPLYLSEHQGIQIDVQPVKNEHQLIISFAMESIDKYYQDKPESILAYLIGHEGKGSILSALKKTQWAMNLTAGSGINGSNFKDFNVSISLTELGEAHINEIISLVFSYIGLLKSTKIPCYYYKEKQTIAELAFIYHEKCPPLDNVSQLVINMQHYPAKDYIFGDYIMSGMSHKNVNHLLNYLNADNVRIIHVSQNNRFSKTSTWYQVPYHVTKIEKHLLTRWHNLSTPTSEAFQENKALYLPKENPYITGKPQIFDNNNDKKHPTKIEDSNGLVVWYQQDTTFKVPKGYIYVGIDSPCSIESIENIAMTRLFVDLFTNTVIEENYDAELASIHYHLYAHQGGMTLQISGFSENQPKLLEKLIYRLKHHYITQDDFNLFKKQLINHWENSNKSKSISQLFSTLSSLMQPNNPTSANLAQALTHISFAHYQAYSKKLFEKVTLEVLIHGNWLMEHANEIVANIKRAFNHNYHAGYSVLCPVVDISNTETLVLPITIPEHDHATVVYAPLETRNNHSIALAMITSHLLSPLFFQEMRTNKQYGYLVGVGYVPINRYPGIAFYIQSPHTDAITLTQAIDRFINESVETITSISPDDWTHLIQGLAGQLQEKDNNLRIKSQRFWAAICNKDVHFSHIKQLINVILSIKFEEIITFIQAQLMTISHPDRIILMSTPTNEPEFTQKIEAKLKRKNIITPNYFTKKSKRKY